MSTTTSDASIRFVLFQRGDEINTWLCTFDWDARRAKANLAHSSNAAMPSMSKSTRLDNDKVLDVKWMQKAGASAHPPTKQARKRAYDALMDFSGTSSLTAVLGSNEVSLMVFRLAFHDPPLVADPGRPSPTSGDATASIRCIL